MRADSQKRTWLLKNLLDCLLELGKMLMEGKVKRYVAGRNRERGK